MISGFHCEADDNCTLLGSYATSGGDYIPTFWENLQDPSSGSGIQRGK
jgi:hypothetical protein